MGFAIMRVAKLKNAGNIGGMLAHVQRQRETPNADPAKDHYAITKGDGFAKAKERIETHKKPQSNSCVGIEVMMTMSPEDGQRLRLSKDKLNEWTHANVQFLQQSFGRGSITHAELHLDETTPHIHALIQPLDERGRLNVNHFIGGLDGRKKLSKLQGTYAEAMQEFGLERGIEGSKATHEDVDKFYHALGQALEQEPPVVEKKNFLQTESAEAYRERITPAWQAQLTLAIMGKDSNRILANAGLTNKRITDLEDETAQLKQQTKQLLERNADLNDKYQRASNLYRETYKKLTSSEAELRRTGIKR